MRSSILIKALTIVCVLLFSLLLVNSCSSRNPALGAETPEIPDAPPVGTPELPDTPPVGTTPTKVPETEPPAQSPQLEAPTQTPDLQAPIPDPGIGSTAPLAEAVDDQWFSDAAFLGNSLVDGFRLFSGLTTCDVYAATSMTVMGADTLINQMAAEQYGKIYILLGINEIGYDAGYFKDQYAAMLDKIIAQQPDAVIYIMGLTPVSEHKSNTDSLFTMDRVRQYNEKLLELAVEKGCYYIDLVDALTDETGYLPASVTTDGIHFAASHYQVWLEYLRTHYADTPVSPPAEMTDVPSDESDGTPVDEIPNAPIDEAPDTPPEEEHTR